MLTPIHSTAPDLIPDVTPRLPPAVIRSRNLPLSAAFGWLGAGWRDLTINPVPSLIYGAVVWGVSVGIVWGLFWFGLDYLLLPALAGFLVVGPLVANGLYAKSRAIEQGRKVSLRQMLLVRPASPAQGLFMGVMLLGLFLLWMRAAVLIYALFFGVQPFPGTGEIVPMLLHTPTGWALLLVGSGIGGIFAAFAFAISVFAVPLLLEQRTDALTAMGSSMATVWANLGVMLCWGGIVAVLFALSVLTGFLGLIVVFPLLGHATWHAYVAVRRAQTMASDTSPS